MNTVQHLVAHRWPRHRTIGVKFHKGRVYGRGGRVFVNGEPAGGALLPVGETVHVALVSDGSETMSAWAQFDVAPRDGWLFQHLAAWRIALRRIRRALEQLTERRDG
jgi:hypothetical protein